MMNWLTGSKLAESRKLVKQLQDASKREHARVELLRMGAEAAPALIEALQTGDQELPLLYQGLLAQIGFAASPALSYSLLNDHPLIRGRVAEVLAHDQRPADRPCIAKRPARRVLYRPKPGSQSAWSHWPPGGCRAAA